MFLLMHNVSEKALIEALFFVSGEPLSIGELKKLTGFSDQAIASAARALMNDYKLRDGGVLIVEIAGGYQMIANPAHSSWIKKLGTARNTGRLSLPALETLAIIAYRQPITKVEVEHIRSVNCDQTIKTLLERRLIKIVGRKEAPGKPLLFCTTKEFLQTFGLKDISELPVLKELTKEE